MTKEAQSKPDAIQKIRITADKVQVANSCFLKGAIVKVKSDIADKIVKDGKAVIIY